MNCPSVFLQHNTAAPMTKAQAHSPTLEVLNKIAEKISCDLCTKVWCKILGLHKCQQIKSISGMEESSMTTAIISVQAQVSPNAAKVSRRAESPSSSDSSSVARKMLPKLRISPK